MDSATMTQNCCWTMLPLFPYGVRLVANPSCLRVRGRGTPWASQELMAGQQRPLPLTTQIHTYHQSRVTYHLLTNPMEKCTSLDAGCKLEHPERTQTRGEHANSSQKKHHKHNFIQENSVYRHWPFDLNRFSSKLRPDTWLSVETKPVFLFL